MKKTLKDLVKTLKTAVVILLVILTLIAVPTVIVSSLGIFFEYTTCNTLKSLNKETNYQWVFFEGCMEQDADGHWGYYSKKC